MAPFWRENQLVRTQKNKSQKGKLVIWRTKMQATVQHRVNLKDSICVKWVQIGAYKFEVGPHLKQALVYSLNIVAFTCTLKFNSLQEIDKAFKKLKTNKGRWSW
jgi:hypothetical protein